MSDDEQPPGRDRGLRHHRPHPRRHHRRPAGRRRDRTGRRRPGRTGGAGHPAEGGRAAGAEGVRRPDGGSVRIGHLARRHLYAERHPCRARRTGTGREEARRHREAPRRRPHPGPPPRRGGHPGGEPRGRLLGDQPAPFRPGERAGRRVDQGRPVRPAHLGGRVRRLVAKRRVLRVRRLAWHLGAGRRRRPDEPGCPHRRPAAVVHGPAGEHPGPGDPRRAPRDRGRGHGGRDPDLRVRRRRYLARDHRRLPGRPDARPGARHQGGAELEDDLLRRFNVDGSDEEVTVDAEPPGGHVAQYEDIFDAIGNGQQPGITVHDAIDALATVRAVYIASTLQRPVKFVDVLEGRYDDVEVSRGIRLPPD